MPFMFLSRKPIHAWAQKCLKIRAGYAIYLHTYIDNLLWRWWEWDMMSNKYKPLKKVNGTREQI